MIKSGTKSLHGSANYCVPEGLDDVSKHPNLTRALLAAGYTGEELQVMRAVEKTAAASATF